MFGRQLSSGIRGSLVPLLASLWKSQGLFRQLTIDPFRQAAIPPRSDAQDADPVSKVDLGAPICRLAFEPLQDSCRACSRRKVRNQSALEGVTAKAVFSADHNGIKPDVDQRVVVCVSAQANNTLPDLRCMPRRRLRPDMEDEIAKAVENRALAIDFHRLQHGRAMADEHGGARVNTLSGNGADPVRYLIPV